MQGKCYAINKSKVIYEVLNTEAIIINFNTGDYFALPHISKLIWQLLERNISTFNMTQLFSAYFKCDENRVLTDITQFLDQLEQEGLIVAYDGGAQQECNELEDIIGKDCRHWEYDSPAVQKYTDVQSLLTIDPIHDVSDAGWPNLTN